MREEEPPLTESGRARIDNFVDSAFAFAVTLLVISSGEPPSNLASLKEALWRVPGFAAGFALVAMFWWTHRSYARVRPEGAIPLLISLAIVFVVLVYVYPLRLFSEVMVSLSPGAGVTGELIRSFGQMRDLYVIYGAGFTALAVLFLLAFLHAAGAARASGDERARRYAGDGAGVWVVLTLAGAASIAVALTMPFEVRPWTIALPGMAYAMIPVGIGLLGAVKAVTRSRRPR
jgi:uncharacterized membrane protein